MTEQWGKWDWKGELLWKINCQNCAIKEAKSMEVCLFFPPLPFYFNFIFTLSLNNSFKNIHYMPGLYSALPRCCCSTVALASSCIKLNIVPVTFSFLNTSAFGGRQLWSALWVDLSDQHKQKIWRKPWDWAWRCLLCNRSAQMPRTMRKYIVLHLVPSVCWGG